MSDFGVVEALERMIVGESGAGSGASDGYPLRVRIVSKEGATLRNGIEYCYVEVSCADGVQYGIEAFGEEALQLRSKALMREVTRPTENAYPIPMITA